MMGDVWLLKVVAPLFEREPDCWSLQGFKSNFPVPSMIADPGITVCDTVWTLVTGDRALETARPED